MFSLSVRFLTHTPAKAAQILQIFNETHNKLSPCRFSALLSASVRARAAYREAVCGRGGVKRRLPFVHLRSADARVRAVGLGGVSVSGGVVWYGESRGFAYISHACGFQFPRLITHFSKRRSSQPCFRRACAHEPHTAKRYAAETARSAASRSCICVPQMHACARWGWAALAYVGGSMAWRKPRVCVHLPRSRLSNPPTYHSLFQTPQFSALLSASVRARAAYRFAVCGRGGASRRLTFVHLRSADAHARAVGVGGVGVSGGRYGMEKAAGSNPDPNNKNKTHNPYGLHGLAYIKNSFIAGTNI